MDAEVGNFRIRPLSEADIDAVIKAAGGDRAHPDADRRETPSADYILVEALIELKLLDDEGLAKPERQEKLAALFRDYGHVQPVVVLDRELLPAEAQRHYDRILEGPIKSAVAKSRKQLRQSRADHPSVSTSVLLVVNNGYTALDHDALLRMVAHRARNDTEAIDGVVVGGCYFYSDSFDSYFLWPLEYLPINVGRPFVSFERLKNAWNTFAERFMTSVMLEEMSPNSLIKGPTIDTQFDLDGHTYVKPTPPIGTQSVFFQNGRPRKNSTGITKCPPVAVTFPDMNMHEWSRFHATFRIVSRPFDDYEHWGEERAMAKASGSTIKPFVPIDVTYDAWEEWCKKESVAKDGSSVFDYANAVFETRVRAIIQSARERTSDSFRPSRYILAITEEIGQDKANDLAHIALTREIPHSDPRVHEIVVNARIFHEHAIAVASAYAVADGVEFVLWEKNLTYAWV